MSYSDIGKMKYENTELPNAAFGIFYVCYLLFHSL